MLCVSNDAASLLLYRSILELEGHCALSAANADEALKVSEGIAIDCVVVDCDDNGIAVTRKTSKAWPAVPILYISGQSEVGLQVYSETGMFVTKEQVIEEPSRCIAEVIRRRVRRCDDHSRKLTHASGVDSHALHEAFVRWLLPW